MLPALVQKWLRGRRDVDVAGRTRLRAVMRERLKLSMLTASILAGGDCIQIDKCALREGNWENKEQVVRRVATVMYMAYRYTRAHILVNGSTVCDNEDAPLKRFRAS